MTTVYFNLPADDLEAVDFLAERDDDNRSAVLRRAVQDYLHREHAPAATSPTAITLACEDYEPVTSPEDLGSLGYDPDDSGEPVILRRVRDGVFVEVSVHPCPHLDPAEADAQTTAPESPPPSFTHRAYGVELDWLGEDGGMAAAGHVPFLRFVAASNYVARTQAGLPNIAGEHGALLEDTLSIVTHVWAVPKEPYSPCEWAIDFDSRITGQTPGAIPMTVMVP